MAGGNNSESEIKFNVGWASMSVVVKVEGGGGGGVTVSPAAKS